MHFCHIGPCILLEYLQIFRHYFSDQFLVIYDYIQMLFSDFVQMCARAQGIIHSFANRMKKGE